MQNARPAVINKTTQVTKTTAKTESDLIMVGAIWQNTGKNGGVYFTMKLNDGKTLSAVDKVLIFTNNDKAGEKSPDLYVFVKTPNP